jgi:Cu2+-exporting ATPase
MFRDKFWLSFALTILVIVWSPDVQHWLGYTAPSFPGSKFIPAILGTVVFFYGGLVFVRGAWGELANRRPGMMTLISLGIIVAFVTSLVATFGLLEIDVWWKSHRSSQSCFWGIGWKCGPSHRLMVRSMRSPPCFRIPPSV